MLRALDEPPRPASLGRRVLDQLGSAKDMGGANLFRQVALDTDNDGYLKVMKDYLVKTLGDAVRPHVPTILKQAERRFLWVRFLRILLQDRDLGRLLLGALKLPAGDDEIFPAYLKQLSADVIGDLSVRSMALAHTRTDRRRLRTRDRVT